MKIAVMGAGAVGCYYGGMLARAGHPVVLIGRPAHVEAVRRDGLRMETLSFDEHVRLDASTETAAVEGAGLVLFCVKSTDTESAGEAMRPHLAPDALVLTLQNGVDNAKRLQSVLPQEVAATVVYVATGMSGPGHVKHNGRGELVIAQSSKSAQIVELLAAAGVPAQISDNVDGALWSKLILNCAYNALSAITQMPYGRLVQGEGVQATIREVVNECLAVAAASGVTVQGDVWQAVQRIPVTMPLQFSSTAQDLARGKLSEIDHLNGYVLRQGEALGVATPANRVLHTLVKLLERRDAQAA
ncbi:ketopantoate reductase family protein [Variovorax sp. KK3]|uniref:ketopantoate reductase family protein n=1 Tax=Variovorax sp. KK3 TaxID=1855728 RepID=UPI00097C7ACB|nr:2-dehydropantoate 2-reductase [Variovorax sp. KK3]